MPTGTCRPFTATSQVTQPVARTSTVMSSHDGRPPVMTTSPATAAEELFRPLPAWSELTRTGPDGRHRGRRPGSDLEAEPDAGGRNSHGGGRQGNASTGGKAPARPATAGTERDHRRRLHGRAGAGSADMTVGRGSRASVEVGTGAGGGMQPLEQPHLEACRRVGLRRYQQQRVGRRGELFDELAAGLAVIDMGKGGRALGPGERAERQLGGDGLEELAARDRGRRRPAEGGRRHLVAPAALSGGLICRRGHGRYSWLGCSGCGGTSGSAAALRALWAGGTGPTSSPISVEIAVRTLLSGPYPCLGGAEGDRLAPGDLLGGEAVEGR